MLSFTKRLAQKKKTRHSRRSETDPSERPGRAGIGNLPNWYRYLIREIPVFPSEWQGRAGTGMTVKLGLLRHSQNNGRNNE